MSVILTRIENLEDDSYVTPTDVAEIFLVPYSTVKSWMRTGRLKKDFQVGKGTIRISKNSLLEFYKENSNVDSPTA